MAWLQWPYLTGRGMIHRLISARGKVFVSTHQWALCSLCPGPYFWARWPRHTPPCHCLSSVTPPGWEGLSLYAQQPGCTPTTEGETRNELNGKIGPQQGRDIYIYTCLPKRCFLSAFVCLLFSKNNSWVREEHLEQYQGPIQDYIYYLSTSHMFVGVYPKI